MPEVNDADLGTLREQHEKAVKYIMTAFKIEPEEKARLQKVAAERGVTFTSLLIDGATLLAGFSPDFMAQIEKTSEITGRDVPTVIQQLLTFFMAREQVMYETFGPQDTLGRAFRFDENGLIAGDRLSELVVAEERKAAEDLIRKLKASARGDKEVRISKREAATIAQAMAARA